jgi:hypothetical protein
VTFPGANPLTWNAQLEKYALDYAKGCAWKHSGGQYGENLAASYGRSDAISTGINGWNNERGDYNPASPMYSHWTQVVSRLLKGSGWVDRTVGLVADASFAFAGEQVWKGTTEVGCALVKCPAGSIQPGWVSSPALKSTVTKPTMTWLS